MYFNQDQFTRAAGAKPVSSINDIDSVPPKLWMAAIQFNEQGQVDQDILLDPSLKHLLPPEERKRIKKGEFFEDMNVISLLDSAIDAAHMQVAMQEDWQKLKATYPKALLSLAEEVNRTGKINPKRITADIFAPEIGMPKITIDQLNKIRYESHLLDPAVDEYYGAFLDRLEIARLQLRLETAREKFFDHLHDRRNDLGTWQQKQEVKKRRELVDFAKMLADVEIKVEETYRQIFIDHKNAQHNKQTLSLGLNATASAIALAAAAPNMLDIGTASPASIEASQEYQAERVELATSAAPDQCGPDSRIFVDGSKFNFIIDEPQKCADLLKMIPQVGQTVKLNDYMSIRANEDGTYHFTLSMMATRPECYTNAADNPYKQAERMERMLTEMLGVPFENGICKEQVFKENTIRPEVFRAMIEGMLGATDNNPNAEYFAFLTAKWFLESRHGNLGQSFNSTAYGLNQFMPFTWLDELTRKGRAMGDADVLDRVIAIAERHGIPKDRFLSSGRLITRVSYFPEVRELHRQYNSDPSHAATYGARYSADLYWRLTNGFENGRYTHPLGAGHTEVTGQMLYSCHMLGERDCTKLFEALANNPDRKVRGLIRNRSFRSNSYMFNKCIPVRDNNGEPVINSRNGKPRCSARVDLTVREFYQSLGAFGQDDTPITGFDHYRNLGSSAVGKNQDHSMVTFLRLGESRNFDFVASEDHQVAVEMNGLPAFLRRMQPAQAIPRASQQVAQAPMPSLIPAL